MKFPALINKFCDAVWEYDADRNEVYFHYDDMDPEFCGRWIPYDEINRKYREQYVKKEDMETWDRMLTPEALRNFVKGCQKEAHFFIQFKYEDHEGKWHEVFFEQQEDGRLLLAGRDIKEIQQNATIAKAVIPEYDYVTCIDVASKNYMMFCSQANKTIIPPDSGDYDQALEAFNSVYVVPEEGEKLTEQMQLDHVIKELEEKDEYILYATMQEQDKLCYKKLRFVYLDERKDKVLLTRTDIGAQIGDRKLREIDRERRIRYLENMPLAFCSIKLLLDDEGNPYDFQFTYCNRAHEELEGVKAGELIGKNFYEFFQETDRRWLTYYYETAYEGINHVIQRYSPEIQKHLLIYTFQTEYGTCECILQDVSEQYFLNQELERSRENINRIMEMTTRLAFQFFPEKEEVIQFKREKNEPERRMTIDALYQLLTSENMLDAAYWDILREAFLRMKNGDHYQSIVVHGKLHTDESWNWYRVTMFDSQDSHTHERMVFGFLQNIDQDKKREDELRKKAQTDSLTGVLNAGTGKEKICEKLERIQEDDGYYQAMFVMDLDNFKSINDTNGHLIGDKMLKEFADVLCRTFRAEDVVYRLGGDEFVVFMEKIREPESSISVILQRLQENSEKVKANYPFFAYSLGIFVTYKKYSFEEYYEKADQALYETKKGNKGNYTIKRED